ncbi:MAG TPA: YciI family protein, partial [Vicinamibacterales bacterium]
MKYLCLIYDDEKKWETMSKAEADAYMGEYFAFTNGIKASGHYLGGNALQPVQTATTIRSRNGKLSTTDGPFAETKEQLGGYYLIEARDLNDAL